MKSVAFLVVLFAGPFSGPAMTLGAGVAAASEPAPKVERWTDVRLVAELREKDTVKVNVITAGEEQKSSFDQCSAAADVALCRVLVSAVSVAAIVGSSFAGQ